MKGNLGDRVRLHHILDAISEVDRYLQNVSFEQFLANSEKRFATIKQIEIIGEACNALTSELREVNPQVQWRQIIGFRNFSIHEYFGVDNQIVWEIAKNDLSELKDQMANILESLVN